MSLSLAQSLVAAFHRKFGVPAPGRPVDAGFDVPDVRMYARMERRAKWIESEIEELRLARDINDTADAFIDIIYFALGGLVELGVDGGPLFDAVHAANMTKVKLPGISKIAKPPGFKHPDIAALIEAQRKR